MQSSIELLQTILPLPQDAGITSVCHSLYQVVCGGGGDGGGTGDGTPGFMHVKQALSQWSCIHL
jgi:hypothetical protein